MATLQQQVQQYLQNTGISLRELSRRSGVSHTAIGKILRGGTYKSDTARALYATISITPINEYVTLHDKVEAIAADRVDHDRGAWDVDLNCAKYRRVMQLEKELEQSKAEVGIVREQRNKLAFACEQLTADLEAEKRNFAALEQVHEQREQQLNDANTAYLMSKSQHDRDVQRLNDANAEIKRLTALSETHGQSWKAACVQAEQLQKQLDHSNQKINELYAGYSQQVDDEREMLAQIDTLFAERDNTATKHDQQVMRLRVYVWVLIAALVFVVASGLVVWGA